MRPYFSPYRRDGIAEGEDRFWISCGGPGFELPPPGPVRQLAGDGCLYYVALMGGEKAAMVFTDAPYNVKIDGHASSLGCFR